MMLYEGETTVTPEEEAAYYEQMHIDDALNYELGERAWFALVYFNPIDDPEEARP
jgi:hypothetical protein